MYNQIWSPLKQEFVPTLSKHGRQALKMYVNSFMTGGAEPGEVGQIEGNRDESDVSEDASSNVGGAPQSEAGDAGGESGRAVDGEDSDESSDSVDDGEKIGDGPPPTGTEQQPEDQSAELAEQQQPEDQAAPTEGEGYTTGADSVEEDATSEGDVTQELSEEQRKNIAAAATQTSKNIKNIIKEPLTNKSMTNVKAELNMVVDAINGK